MSENAAIHHVADVVHAIHATGALGVFRPPYSPEFMPCEGIFSQVKSWIRENDAALRACDEPEQMVFQGFFNVPRTDVQNFIYHAGYTSQITGLR